MNILTAPWFLPVCLISAFIFICCLISDTRERLEPQDFQMGGTFLAVVLGAGSFLVMMTSTGQMQLVAFTFFCLVVLFGGAVRVLRGDLTPVAGMCGHSIARFLLGLFFR